MSDSPEEQQPGVDERRGVQLLAGHDYISVPNEVGVDGYNLVADSILTEGYPMPGAVDPLLKRMGIKLDKTPFKVELPRHDEEDIFPLAVAAVAMVFKEYGYSIEDTKGLSIVSPKGPIVMTLEGGKQITLVENYDEDTNTIAVANSLFYDDDIRGQLKTFYNIPTNASEQYLITYLIAHSTVHHIQKIQNRMMKHPKGYKHDPGAVVKEVLELDTEKEAHNVGVKVADKIWQEVIDREIWEVD
jgi:hypothetical protein